MFSFAMVASLCKIFSKGGKAGTTSAVPAATPPENKKSMQARSCNRPYTDHHTRVCENAHNKHSPPRCKYILGKPVSIGQNLVLFPNIPYNAESGAAICRCVWWGITCAGRRVLVALCGCRIFCFPCIQYSILWGNVQCLAGKKERAQKIF